mmetsp:Transcript_17376/g.27167  ORF Transcript_17376/g.27167 Transcript_17376/m.27167 type:complete len:154 (+) Transcript_17376:105-566(+)
MNYSTFDERAPLISTNPFWTTDNEYRETNNAELPVCESTQLSTMQRSSNHSSILQQNEEKMIYISEELTEMKDMFGDLRDIVDDEQDVVDLIECGVHELKDNVVTGTEHLEKAEQNLKKLRCNRCVCFAILIIGIVLFLLYLWLTSDHHHRVL